MKRALTLVFLALVLVASVAGLLYTAPQLGSGGPGFVAKQLSPVLGWTVIGVGAAVALTLVWRRKDRA